MPNPDALFYRLLYPRLTCLVTSSHEEKSNVNAVDWAMPVSAKPPIVAIAVNKRGLTADLISESKEFVLAVPPESMKDAVANCAKTSGKFIDKFSEFEIRTEKGKFVGAPLLADAISQMECKVIQILDCGDHDLVVGEVVEIHFPDDEKNSPSPLFNRGSKGYFGLPHELLEMKPQKDEERKDKDEPKPEEKKEDKNGKPEEKKQEDTHNGSKPLAPPKPSASSEKDEKKQDEKKEEKNGKPA
jgi:flavin reductase (DIM6/NTAB) family NADH-FMN oxidoreductase RutF